MKNTTVCIAAMMLGFGMCVSAAPAAEIQVQGPQGRTVRVTALTPNIIRVDNTAPGQAVADVQAVLPLEAADDAATVSAAGTALYTLAGIKAELAADGSLSISTPRKGTAVFDAGYRSQKDGKNIIKLATSSQGSYYGAGERGHKLNMRGDTLVMYNRQNYGYTGSDPRISQMNITMPLFLSSDGFAIVFDDFAAARMALGNTIEYTTESSRPVSYYYIGGVDNMADLTEALTELTGRQPLAPLWALGYITSKYGYRTQAETEAVIDTLKQKGYPVDGIVLDLYWYGKEQDMGRLAWEPSQWPEPEKMLASLKEKGVNLVPISQPYVLRNGKALDNYNMLAPQGMFVADSTGSAPQEVVIWVGEGGMFDVSNPKTRRWLTERYAQLTDMGIGGWWGDLGEPEVHPETGRHANGLTARQYHNMYGNDWSRIISELYAERYPDTRLLTLMRGGTTGLQRYSVFPWSTDVSRSWGGLEPQIRIMLNSGLSGLGYMSSDLGGFAVDREHPYLPELYVRWVQNGLYSPVFRTHATENAEPYKYPMYEEEILLPLVKERYRMLPYNYTLAYENAAYGWPLVRPLDFRKSADGAYDNISDQYLWGDEIMVAPVVTEGETSRSILFPEGSDWVDMSNPSVVFKGGQVTGSYAAPLNKIPLFARDGAFIPTAVEPMENTGDYKADKLAIAYYPAGNGESRYTFFDDDHTSPKSIEENRYRLVHFNGERTAKQIKVAISSEGSFEGAPQNIGMDFSVHCLAARPKNVKVNGKKVEFTFNNGSVTFPVDYNTNSTTTITIAL